MLPKMMALIFILISINIHCVFNFPINDTVYIIGGWATTGPYPFMAELRDEKGGHHCGGSIYSEYWIITAGHCVGNPYVAVGVHSRSKKSTYTSVHKVVKSIRHPNYKYLGGPDGAMTHDIGLLKLETPIDIKGSKDNLVVLDLPKQGQSFGGELRAIGWGTLTESGSYSDILRAVNVPIVNDNTCASAYGSYFNKETMFCAGSPGKDTCGGDSGGPVVKIDGSSEVLVGITSWGKGCGKSGYPGIYTRAASYVNWIKDNAK